MDQRKRVANEKADNSRRSTYKKLKVFRNKVEVKRITVADIKEKMDLSNCILQCRVEYVIPPAQYKRDDGSEGTVYKFLLSDGATKTMETVAFGVFGKKVFNKLRKNKCYYMRGEITAKLRQTEFVSESNSDVQLQLSNVDVDPWKDSPMQSCGLISLSELRTQIMMEDRFIRRISNAVVTGGTIYQYDGCSVCLSRIKDVGDSAGKYYCTSNSWKCEDTQEIPRDRKQLLIFHSIDIREENGAEVVEDLTLYDSGCKILLESLTPKDNCENADPMFLQRFIGSTVSLRIKGYRNDKGYCRREILSVDDIRPPQVLSRDEHDDHDEEFSDSSSSSDYELPPDLPELTEFKRLSLSSASDNSVETVYARDDSKPRGLILFVNIETITKSDGKTIKRNGSERDRHNVSRTLESLGYDMFEGGHKDLSSKDLKTKIELFKEELKRKDYSSLLVIITSHGHYNGVAMGDGVTINFWTDVVYQFAESKFPEFKGKPKIFVPASCRYFNASNIGQKTAGGATKDILVLFPCMPGYSSVRDSNKDGKGTWFIYFLMETILEHYDHLHLIEIMKKVQQKQDKRSEEVLQIQDSSVKKSYQCGTYSDCLFKKFYF